VSSSDGGLEYGAANGGSVDTAAPPASPASSAASPSATALPADDQPDTNASLRTSNEADSAAKETQAAASGVTEVVIGDFFFRPQDINIHTGQTVTWTNEGTVPEGHTVTGDGFDSKVIKHGETYSRVFNDTGTFDYVCTLHPNMRGSVTVTVAGGDASAGGGDGTGTSSGSSSAPLTPSTTPATTAASSGDDSGGSLAHTGLNLILLAEIAGCFIATGLLIQRLIYGAP
jgi:plastocyanin